MRVAVVAGDAGGARAVLPVAQRLRTARVVAVDCYAYGPAAPIFVEAGLGPIRPSAEALERLGRYDRLVVATSINQERWELRFTIRARELGIPSVAVLDFWGQYTPRFTLEDRLVLPDRIAVMDRSAQAEMIAEGFEPGTLSVTGQPALDELSEYARPEVRTSCRQELRRIAGAEVRPGPVVLYASQPLSQLHDPAVLGFHESEVLAGVIAAGDRLLSRLRQSATLIIKPHPREAGHRFALPQTGPALTVRVLNESDVTPRLAAAGADLVVGMNSMLLLEACLLGTPVISYQPNLLLPDVLPSNRLGWSRGIFRPDDLEPAMEEELFRPRLAPTPARGADQSGATARVIAMLLAEGAPVHSLRRIA